jgi:hypothetical protein
MSMDFLTGMTAALRKSPCVPTATALRLLTVPLEKFAWREQMLQTPLFQSPTPLVLLQISLLQTPRRLTHAQAASLTVTTATTASLALAYALAATTAPTVPLAAVGATTALVRGMEKNKSVACSNDKPGRERVDGCPPESPYGNFSAVTGDMVIGKIYINQAASSRLV